MSNKVVPISDLGEIITGKTPSSNSPEDFGNEVLFITPSDDFDHKYIRTTARYLSSNGVEKLKSKLLPSESVMVTCIGSDMGKLAMNGLPAITNQQINSIVVDKNKYDPSYVYYKLKKSYEVLRQYSTGSTAIPLLNKTDFSNIEITVEDNLSTQQKIAAVLSALDAKIELNARINAELESMAKTLYDYWFVQFAPLSFGHPPKYDMETLGNTESQPVVFGGTEGGRKMVWNEVLKREIPLGWEVAELGGFVDIFDSKRIPLSSSQRAKMQGQYPYYGATSIMDYVNDYIFDGEYLLIAEDGSVMGDDGLAIVQYIWGKTWVNNHAHVLLPKDPSNKDYLYFLLKSISVVQIMTGSIQKKITQDNLLGVKFALPDKETLKLFSEFARPIRQRMINIFEESQTLTELRDWLLPMLMNGQVKVG